MGRLNRCLIIACVASLMGRAAFAAPYYYFVEADTTAFQGTGFTMSMTITRDSTGGPFDNVAQVLSFATNGSMNFPGNEYGLTYGTLKSGLTLTDVENVGSSALEITGSFGSKMSYVVGLSGSQLELAYPLPPGGFAGFAMGLEQGGFYIMQNPAGYGAATEIFRDGLAPETTTNMDISTHASIPVLKIESGSRSAAATTFWTGGSGAYADAAHWTSGVPQIVAIKDTEISPAAPVTVTLDRGGLARNLTLRPGNVIDTNGYGLTLSGRFENEGVVNVSGVLAMLFNSRLESVLTSTAPGVVNLVNSAGSIDARADLVIESTQTVNMAQFTAIASGGTLTNDGHITLTGGYGTVTAKTSLVNTGSILAQNAGMALYAPTILNNGSMMATGVAATFTLNPGVLPLQTITGSGDWNVSAGINILGKVNFTTTGHFTLQPGAIVSATAAAAGSTFTLPNLAGGASSSFSASSATITITQGDATKPFDGALSGSIALVKNGAGTQIFNGPVTTSGGTIINGGMLQVNDPVNALGTGAVHVNAGGRLGGVGVVNANTFINVGGTLAPGNAVPGELSMFSLRLPAGSTLNVDLSTTGPTDVAHVFAGTTHVGGVTLNITDAGLTAGDTAWFLEYENTIIADAAGNLTGIIDASNFVLGNLPENILGHLVAERNGTSGVVAGRVGFFVDAVLADADFDSDQDVDYDDLVRWQAGYGDTTAGRIDGDANRDHRTDGDDFLVWQRQLFVPEESSGAAVPEPSAIALALLAALTATTGSRRGFGAFGRVHR